MLHTHIEGPESLGLCGWQEGNLVLTFPVSILSKSDRVVATLQWLDAI